MYECSSKWYWAKYINWQYVFSVAVVVLTTCIMWLVSSFKLPVACCLWYDRESVCISFSESCSTGLWRTRNLFPPTSTFLWENVKVPRPLMDIPYRNISFGIVADWFKSLWKINKVHMHEHLEDLTAQHWLRQWRLS